MKLHKYLRMTAAALLTAGLLPVSAAALPFQDVAVDAWYYSDVEKAYSTGLINGKSAVKFDPDDNLTYAEAVKLAACMHQIYTGAPAISGSGAQWYQPYVDYCLANGIITQSYNWNVYATRAAYMDIFSRALPEEALAAVNEVADGMIPDVPASHVYADSIYLLYEAGIVRGVDNNYNCKPELFVKRSEVAAILTRMMDEDARIIFAAPEDSDSVYEDPDDYEDSTDDDEDGNTGGADAPSDDDGTDRRKDDSKAEDDESTKIVIEKEDIEEIVTGSTSGSGSNATVSDATNSGSASSVGKRPEGILDTTDDDDVVVEYGDMTLCTTPVGRLEISEQWKDLLSVEESGGKTPYTAEIYAETDSGEELLFTVAVGTNGKSPLGYITDGGKTFDICVTIASPSLKGWSDEDIHTFHTVQEEVNTIMDQFRAMDGFRTTRPEAAVEDDTDTTKPFTLLETPVGRLKFPGKWKNSVYADENVSKGIYKAEVFGETGSGDALLFTVYVNSGRVDSRIGFVPSEDDETMYLDICVEIASPPMKGWSAVDQTLVHTMQEAVNDLMDQIRDMDGFDVELPGEGEYDEEIHGAQKPQKQEPEEIEWSEFVLLDTPIGELTCSEQWEDRISADETTENGVYTAVVFAEMKGSDVELFRIIVGTEDDGFFVAEVDGMLVYAVYEEISVKSSWSEKEIEELYAMQETFNDICDQIMDLAE